jgi:nicotinamide-nucleotide amidase
LRIEIINTGTELMLGQVLNTHQQWLCRQLADSGYAVSRQAAVADTAEELQQALREALARTDLLITTGGLGPTPDDLTRQTIAELLGLPLRENPAVWADIQAWFAARNRPLPDGARIQALVPEGALVLHNTNGTAPGLVIEVNWTHQQAMLSWFAAVPVSAPRAVAEPAGAAPTEKALLTNALLAAIKAGQSSEQPAGASPAGLIRKPKLLIMLPGPPRELRPMFSGQALPLLQRLLPPDEPLVCHTLRTTGLGESMVQERIARPLAPLIQRGLEIGYCARPGEVDLRLAARGAGAADLIAQAQAHLRGLLGEFIFGVEEDSLEAVVVRQLTKRQQTLVLAESCTGGRVAGRITDVPGASVVFLGGLVTYSNQLKQSLLGVQADTLASHGAVSEPTARQMAQGARARYQADYAVAITGIAGPASGSEAKPVGTVFIALATAAGTVVVRQLNRYDRETFKHVTSQQALELLRRELLAS